MDRDVLCQANSGKHITKLYGLEQNDNCIILRKSIYREDPKVDSNDSI